MRFSTLFMAVLPALALAQEELTPGPDGSTTVHVVSTATLTRTIFLSKVDATPTPASNATMSYKPTHSSSSSSTETEIDTEETNPPVKEDKDDAASALNAMNVVFAGLAGVVAVALL